ncbi:MAG: hypothetical protein ACRESI_01975 [Gammaproteobacteria bacterium]
MLTSWPLARGVFPDPEGSATLAAQVRLLDSGWLKGNETVVLFNTGASLKLSICGHSLVSDLSGSFILFIYKILLIHDTNQALATIN